MKERQPNTQLYKVIGSLEPGDSALFNVESDAQVTRERSRIKVHLHSDLFDLKFSFPLNQAPALKRRRMRQILPR